MGLVAFIIANALFAFIFYIPQVIAYWKIFTKAGEEGWKSIIPIYKPPNLHNKFTFFSSTQAGFRILP